jgi:hypothetical protein
MYTNIPMKMKYLEKMTTKNNKYNNCNKQGLWAVVALLEMRQYRIHF